MNKFSCFLSFNLLFSFVQAPLFAKSVITEEETLATCSPYDHLLPATTSQQKDTQIAVKENAPYTPAHASFQEWLGAYNLVYQGETPIQETSPILTPEEKDINQKIIESYTDDTFYDQTAFLTAHNAHASHDDNWVYAQQTHNIKTLFEKFATRGFMVDIYHSEEDIVLCHEPVNYSQFKDQENKESDIDPCWLSFALRGLSWPNPFNSTLKDLKDLLDSHPQEIITLFIENHISKESEAILEQAFQELGLMSYLYIKPNKAAWPTLGEMRKSNKRLVVFDDQNSKLFMPVSEYQETQYSLEQYPECQMRHFSVNPKAEYRRDETGKKSLFVFNHFYAISLPWGSPTLFSGPYAAVNSHEAIQKRLNHCEQDNPHRIPTFMTFDYIEQGSTREITYNMILKHKESTQRKIEQENKKKKSITPYTQPLCNIQEDNICRADNKKSKFIMLYKNQDLQSQCLYYK